MAYANLDFDYFQHPKVRRLVGLVGRGAQMFPPALWTYCGKFHSKDGRLEGYSDGEIEALIGWWGNEGDLVKALVAVGFLDRVEDVLCVHDWETHQGHIEKLKTRSQTMNKTRWGKLSGEEEPGTPTRTPAKPKDSCQESSQDSTEESGQESPQRNPPTVPTVPTSTERHARGILAEELRKAEEEPPHIPTLAEVQAYAASNGGLPPIPAEFAKGYWNYQEVHHGWLTKGRTLKNWRRELAVWWERDSPTWKPRSGVASGRTSAVIEAELQAIPQVPENFARRQVLIDELVDSRQPVPTPGKKR